MHWRDLLALIFENKFVFVGVDCFEFSRSEGSTQFTLNCPKCDLSKQTKTGAGDNTMPEYKMNVEKRAEIQANAISLNATHKKVMQTKSGQKLESEMISFRLLVKTEIELGAKREVFDSVFEGGKIPTDSTAYAIISAVLTKYNAANGLTGASGGGGGNTEQKKTKKKSANAGKKAAKANKDKPFNVRLTASGFAMILANFNARLEKAKPEAKACEVWKTKQFALACASLKDSQVQLRIAATSGAESPKAKSNAKKLVKANSMPKSTARTREKKVLANT